MGEYDLFESPDGSEIRAISPQAAAVYYPGWKPLPREIEQERREAEGGVSVDIKKLRKVAEAHAKHFQDMPIQGERIIELLDRLEAAELRADREAGAFRLMCEAFQRLEEILGMDTGGGMGPGPALNVVERLVKERATVGRHAVLVQAAAIDEAGYRFVDAHQEYGDSTPLDAVGNFMHRMAEELREQVKESSQ